MNPFEIYPQHPNAHPERPWWRAGSGWHRRDGARVWFEDGRSLVGPGPGWWSQAEEADFIQHADCDAALSYVDAAHPLPAPPPLCGQVWVLPNGEHGLVTSVVGGLVTLGATSYPEELWPPGGAVLVAGPGSPWAPAGWRP